jgi:hypothetical protein
LLCIIDLPFNPFGFNDFCASTLERQFQTT